MSAPRRVLTFLLTCSLALGGAGCTSLKTIQPATQLSASAFGTIKPGDTVVVQTRDGRTARFVVQEVRGDGLVAKDGSSYSRDDMIRVQRRSFSGGRTALLVGGIVGGLALVLAAAAAVALASLGG